MVERPFALTVAREARAHTCATCLADSRSQSPRWERRCDRCATQYYCSERCAAAAEEWHTAGGVECAALLALEADPALDEEIADQVAQAIRILANRAASLVVDAGPAGVAGYDAYAERLVGTTPRTQEGMDWLRAAVTATLRALPDAAGIPAPTLADVLRRHQCNLYGVTGPAGDDVASASFVGFMHLFNHACCPNLAFDSARRQQWAASAAGDDADAPSADGEARGCAAAPCFALVALEDVTAGEELCISYTSSAEGPTQRLEHLRDWYGFDCACPRCTCGDVAQELDYCERLDERRCAFDDCGSGLGVHAAVGSALLRCVHCGEEWDPRETE
jgi:hypothetical protein